MGRPFTTISIPRLYNFVEERLGGAAEEEGCWRGDFGEEARGAAGVVEFTGLAEGLGLSSPLSAVKSSGSSRVELPFLCYDVRVDF